MFPNTLREYTPIETGVPLSSKEEVTPQRERVHSSPIKGVNSSTLTGVLSNPEYPSRGKISKGVSSAE
jgi:hypothetical protein